MDYEECRRWAKKFYKNIGRISSPALNGDFVVFNNKGFKHLLRKAKVRSKSEQMRRFKLLPYAVRIIRDPQVAVRFRKCLSNGQTVKYWVLTKMVFELRIKVVVRQVGDGSKYFYSAMSRRVKPKDPERGLGNVRHQLQC